MPNELRRALDDYRRLPKPIWALAAARLVNSAGSFVFPFFTLLLTDRLEYGTEQAGRIIMISMAMFVPGSLLGGTIADRIGRRKLLIMSQVAAAACLGTIGFLPMTRSVIGLILAQQFFLGLMVPASSAATYDLTHSGNRQSAFSLLYLGMNVGFAVGPLLAGLLYESHARWLFLGDAGTTLISLLFVVFMVPETRPDTGPAGKALSEDSAPSPVPSAADDPEGVRDGSAIRLILQRPVLLSFVVLMAVPWFVYGQHSFTLPIFAKERFPENGAVMYGMLMSLNALLVVGLTVPVIRLTRGIRPVVNVMIHSILYAVGFGILYLAVNPAVFYISVTIWTIGEIIGATNIEVFTANHTPSSHRGRFTSILPLISGTGRALSPWLTGLFLTGRSTSAAWLLCFVLGMAAAFGFLMIRWAEGRGSRSKRS